MRRIVGLFTVTAMVVGLSSVALAGSGSWGGYRDEFKTVSYTGSDGSIYWGEDPWIESNDDANPGAGSVYVDSEGRCAGGNCLKIFAEGERLDGVGAWRHADTSVFSDFEVCYEIGFTGDDDNTNAVLLVEKSINGGGNWYSLGSYPLYDGFWSHPVHQIGAYEDFIVRFTVTGDMLGELFVDDVEIKGELAESPTTTTSTTSSTTSTTVHKTTTTTKPATTTTEESTTTSTTSTTVPRAEATTTTTVSDSTSTTEALIVPGGGDDSDGGSGGPPEGSGIRESATGIQASFDGELFGDIALVSGIGSVNFRMAAEIIEASWVWLVLLALVIAYSIVSGLERRRSSTEDRSTT